MKGTFQSFVGAGSFCLRVSPGFALPGLHLRLPRSSDFSRSKDDESRHYASLFPGTRSVVKSIVWFWGTRVKRKIILILLNQRLPDGRAGSLVERSLMPFCAGTVWALKEPLRRAGREIPLRALEPILQRVPVQGLDWKRVPSSEPESPGRVSRSAGQNRP